MDLLLCLVIIMMISFELETRFIFLQTGRFLLHIAVKVNPIYAVGALRHIPVHSNHIHTENLEWHVKLVLLVYNCSTFSYNKVSMGFLHCFFILCDGNILMFASISCGCCGKAKNIWITNSFDERLRGL